MANVYANRNADGYAIGYLNFYLQHLKDIAGQYYQRYPADRKRLESAFKDERFHFARRISKTHPYAMPDFVMEMKMKGFIKEVCEYHVNRFVKPSKPVQLELTFT